MRRVSAALAGTAIALLWAGAGLAASRNPADALLDRARDGVRRNDFSGALRLRWRDGSARHVKVVRVTAEDGALRLDDGRVMSADGSSWIRVDHRYHALDADAHDVPAPPVAAKYQVAVRRGKPVLERDTRELTVRRGDVVVERVSFDDRLGIVLARTRYDASGAVRSSMRYVQLEVGPRSGSPATPPPASKQSRPLGRDAGPATVGDGFRLVDARRVADGDVQLRYSDGIFDASVFQHGTALDWTRLPRGGSTTRAGGERVRRYETAAGTVVVWESEGTTITCVTDAPRSDWKAIVADLSRDDESGWEQVVRFVTSPFRWG